MPPWPAQITSSMKNGPSCRKLALSKSAHSSIVKAREASTPNRRAGTSQADSFSSFYFGINANRVSDTAAISFERNGGKRTGNVP
jgi:hypothetical protein